MADVRPFRALRYDAARVDPADTIAPPYDVISPAEQQALYSRSPYNIVRVEYGEARAGDGERENRYTRAAADLRQWLGDGVLVRDGEPAFYRYRQEFAWQGVRHTRDAFFGVVRLEEWERGIVKPHERTLATPKQDRLNLLRATRTQVSPVYSLYRNRAEPGTALRWPDEHEVIIDVTADGQRHVLSRVGDADACERAAAFIARSDVYIADGHHRYETALNYRDELRARAADWSGDEPANFVLMALTHAYDQGLLVLPTHRLLHTGAVSEAQIERIEQFFEVEDVSGEAIEEAQERLTGGGRFLALGLKAGAMDLLSVRDQRAIEALMPAEQPQAWKQLDVSVLQYGVLEVAFGIDEATLTAGKAVTYTQDAVAAAGAVRGGDASCAFLLAATPVDAVLAVADAGGRMPQKSTFFYPKLPTGLVLHPVESA